MAKPTSWEEVACAFLRPDEPDPALADVEATYAAAQADYEARRIDYQTYMLAYIAYLRAREAVLKAGQKRPPRKRKRKPGAPGEHLAETDSRAKITEDDVRSIRQRHAAGENRNDLGQEFGITSRSINLIVARRRWAHVTD